MNIVIMAGGRGERFWPKSRMKVPKQLLKLTGDETMIQATVRRVKSLAGPCQQFIVTNLDYALPIHQQLPDIPENNLIIEPEGRNTAPCIGLAALHVERVDPEGIMVVLPSDHLIQDEEALVHVLQKAAKVAGQTDGIVTIGIQPSRPETGYGYIQLGEALWDDHDVCRVNRFMEKPDYEKAVAFLADGNYLWNSGMFVWKVSTIWRLIQKHLPELHHGLEVIKEAVGTPRYETVLREVYGTLPKISVDYGIMEKASEVYVIKADMGWDDLGTWTAVARLLPKDAAGNRSVGKLLPIDSTNVMAFGPDKLIATLGVEDLLIIATDDAVLVAHKDREQEVRRVLEEIRAKGWNEYL